MELIRNGNSGIIDLADVAYSFHIEAADTGSDFEFFNSQMQKRWESDPLVCGRYRIVPFGETNNLPVILRDVIEENNLVEGIFRRQRGLIWGQGPALYRNQLSENKIERIWISDPEVESWLRSWNYKQYLLRIMNDFVHSECTSTKFFRNRGVRIRESSFISGLRYVSIAMSRYEWPEDRLNPKRIIVGDFDDERYDRLIAYPILDDRDPFRYRVSMQFNNLASFARRFYGVPGYFGAINWIKRASAIPRILSSLTDNSLNIKWHIISPASYWDQKRDLLKEQCSLKNVEYSEKMLEDLKDEIFKKLGKVLAGEKNVGKFFTSEAAFDEFGNMEKWEIMPIDQKFKDFTESQISIADKADSATTSGAGLHPALSNIMIDGKLSSGSEMLYALKLYLATEIDIPEMIITNAINTAIRINWPDKDIQLGFYHDVVKTEDSVTAEERTKNKK